MNPVRKATYASAFFFLVFICAQQRVSAEGALVRLSGAVSDSTNRKPISGAVVALPDLSRSVLSDGNGGFVLDSVPPAAHFMIITAKGYKVRRIDLAMDDLSAPFNVKLAKSLSPDGMEAMAARQATTASSQTRVVTGKVIDKKTGQPVPRAIVSALASNAASPTSLGGEFSITIPAAVTCTLLVRKTGYEQSGILVDSAAINPFVEVALSQSSVYELQDMDVSADRIEIKQMVKTSEKISQVKMSPELLAKLPNLGQADLFRSLQLLPGVSGTNEATSGLYVRGGTPDQNLIILDQMPIYYVDHFYGFFSAFNPRAIDDVTFYKGGFGSQWGGRLSSVVELSSAGKDMASDTDGVKAGAGMGLLSSDAFVKIPLNSGKTASLMLAGRRAMTDIFKTNLFNRLFNRMHGTDSLNSFDPSQPIYPGMPAQNRISYQPKFYFWDLNGLAAFNLGSRGKLTTTFFASQDDQDNSLDTSWLTRTIMAQYNYIKDPLGGKKPEMDTLRLDTTIKTVALKNKEPVSWGNICIGQQWEQKWTDAFKTRLNVSYSQFLDEKKEDYFRTDSTADRFSDTTRPHDTTVAAVSWMASKNKIVDISGRFDNSIKLSEANTLNLGMEISRKAVTYERDTALPDTTAPEWQWGKYSTTLQLPVSTHDTSLSWAVYAEDEMKFGDRAGLTPGARLYWFQLASAYAVDPRLSVWYKPLESLKLKAAWGLYTQEIHRVEEEDITGGGKFVWLLSSPSRPLEKSQQAIAGGSWETDHFRIDIEGYLKRMSGLLTISERSAANGQSSVKSSSPYAQPFDPNRLSLFEGTGFAKGVELLAQVKNVNFPLFSKNTIYDGWAAYTLSRVENTYAVFNDGNPFPATQDHTHEIKLVNSLEWEVSTRSSIELGAVWLYSTGAPYTAPLGKYELMLLDSSMTRTYTFVSDKNIYRLPDYHRLDLSAAWKSRFGRHFEGRLAIGLFNAYNRENILERTYKEISIGSGGGIIKIPNMGTPVSVFIPVDRVAMSITPNAAIEITARF